MSDRILIQNVKDAFIRDELEGALLVIHKGMSTNEALIMNRIGKEIMELCDGQNTQSDIIRILGERYQEIPLEQINSDVNSFVDQMLKGNILKRKGDGGMYNGKDVAVIDGLTVHRCGEGDYKEIRDILNSEGIIDFMNSAIKEEDYSPISLRTKLFNYFEEFYIIRDQEQNIGLFSILCGRLMPNSVALVGRVKVLCEKPQELLVKCLEESMMDFHQNIEQDCSKIRINWVGNGKEIEGEIGEIFGKAGFQINAVLEEEFGEDKNQIIMDRKSA